MVATAGAKAELVEYRDEQNDMKNIEFVDKVEVPNLMECAGGTLAMLGGENVVKAMTELLTRDQHKDKVRHLNFLKPKEFDHSVIGMQHYTMDVFYCVPGFLEKKYMQQPFLVNALTT